MARLHFSNGVDGNVVNDQIMDRLKLKKGDVLTFTETGETATADFRRGVGWYFRKGVSLYHYEGTRIEYFLNKGLATLTRV